MINGAECLIMLLLIPETFRERMLYMAENMETRNFIHALIEEDVAEGDRKSVV